MSTDLPRIRAAIAMDTVESGEILVALTIRDRTRATMCSATKKKTVGGIIARSSSLIFSVALPITSLRSRLEVAGLR